MAVTGETLDARLVAQSAPLAGADRLLTMDRVDPAAWESAIAEFAGLSPEQTLTFARLRWPTLTHEPLILRRGPNIVGGALMMVQRLPLGLGSVAIGKWAPMCRDIGGHARMGRYGAMIETLIAEYAGRRGMMLALLPRACADARGEEHDYLLARGFVPGSNVPFPDRYIVDLRVPEEAHRKQLGSKWRYHLNHAEKAGLEFEAADDGALPDFAALYRSMSHRKKFPDHSAYDTVPALLAMAEDRLRPQLFFVRQAGDIVAGAVIFTAGDTAIYLYGATNERALPLRAGYFLHWQIVRWLKAHRPARWYDLGGNDGFLGLHQFKKGMVGKAGAIVPLPPMLHYANGKLPLLLGTGAFALRDAWRNLRYRLTVGRSDLAKPDLARPAPAPRKA
jgi:hypothetical protein